jgi:hypothetical protein
MVPIRALDTTAAFAGPPRLLPVTAIARSMKKDAPPDASRKLPKIMNMITIVAAVPSGVPKIPFVPLHRCEMILLSR